MSDTVRTHVVLPGDLVERVDRLVGKRRRSRYLEEAVREKLARDARTQALHESAGILAGVDYPEWTTPESVTEWVADQRRGDVEAEQRKLGRLSEPSE